MTSDCIEGSKDVVIQANPEARGRSVYFGETDARLVDSGTDAGEGVKLVSKRKENIVSKRSMVRRRNREVMNRMQGAN